MATPGHTCTEASDNVLIPPGQKVEGKRVFDKKHFCLYCSKPYSRIANHLENVHHDKPDVAKVISLTKNSRERKLLLAYIRNKGNFAHNASVLQSGKGALVPFKRPVKPVDGKEFMHCGYCQGLFLRKVLWRHLRNCPMKTAPSTKKPGQNRVLPIFSYTTPVPSLISMHLTTMLHCMKPGPVADIIQTDPVITELGKHLLRNGGLSAQNQQHVRERLRQLGRLVDNGRRCTTLRNMADFVNPQNYLVMVEAVKEMCGYDGDSNKFRAPSIANKLGHSLVKISELLMAQGLMSEDEALVRRASEFQEVHKAKWHAMVSATAVKNLTEANWNMPTLIPFTSDVQKLHHFLNCKRDLGTKALSVYAGIPEWTKLTKVCLSQIMLFNRRREGEVASMPLSAFLSRDVSDHHPDLDWALTELEKRLCSHFARVIISGKRGRPVPILLTPDMVTTLELLVEHREACGVLKENPYMFARPKMLTHIHGSDCLRAFAHRCRAECPRALTSTRLRKQTATLTVVLNMTEAEMDQLGDFLGHDIHIQHEFYRLPDKTLQLAKISKLLMALEQGRVAEFQGMNLDQITVAPDEAVVMEAPPAADTEPSDMDAPAAEHTHTSNE